MKTLKSHTAGLGETWSLLDNENTTTAICPRVNPDNGLQISSDEAERLLTDCVGNGNLNPDEESNMWVHAVQPADADDGLDSYAFDEGETEDQERSNGPSYTYQDEERDGTFGREAPYPPVAELADDVSQAAYDMEEQLRRIKEMAEAMRDTHEAITTEGEVDAQDYEKRETLAATLTALEYCQGGVRTAEKMIGADCIL